MGRATCTCGCEEGTNTGDCERCRLLAEIERLNKELAARRRTNRLLKAQLGRERLEHPLLATACDLVRQLYELLRLSEKGLTGKELREATEEARPILRRTLDFMAILGVIYRQSQSGRYQLSGLK